MREIQNIDLSILRRLFVLRNSQVFIDDVELRSFVSSIQLRRSQENSQIKSLITYGNNKKENPFSEYHTVIQFGGEKCDSHPYMEEFHYVSVGGNIRWIYAAGNLQSVIDFYHVSTFRAKLIKFGIQLIAKCKLDRWISKKVRIYSVDQIALKEVALGIPHDQFSVFFGTPCLERTVLVALLNKGKSSAFVKVGINSESVVNVGNESMMLYKLNRQTFSSFAVPTIKSASCLGVVGISKLDREIQTSTHRFTLKHAKVLCEMYLHENSKQLIGDSYCYDKIQENMSYLDEAPSKKIEALRNKVETLMKAFSFDDVFHSSLNHGDFTPWNMFEKNDKIYLYDWELSSRNLPFLFDLFHFHFQTGIFLKKASFEKIFQDINLSISSSKPIQKIIRKHGIKVRTHLQLYLACTISRKLKEAALLKDDTLLNDATVKVWNQALDHALPKTAGMRMRFMEQFNDLLSETQHAFLKFSHRTLENVGPGSDLDIAIVKSDVKKAVEFCQKHPFVARVKKIRKSYMTTLRIFFHGNEFLSVDLIHNMRRKTTEFMTVEKLVQSAKMTMGNVYIPELKYDLEYSILFYTLNHASLPEKYINFFNSYDSCSKQCAVYYFREKYNVDIYYFEDLFEKQEELKEAFEQYNRRFNRKNLLQKARFIVDYIRDTWAETFIGKGFVMSISGVDGIGKSTIVRQLVEEMKEKYRKDVILLRHRPRVLPILSTIKYGSAEKAEKKATHSNPVEVSSSTLSSALRFGYYYLDYLLGQIYVKVKYVWRGKIVLYERYYFDFINNPERTNLRVNKRLVKRLYFFITKPKLNILLYAPVNEIYKRKQELEPSDINRLMNGYMTLFVDLARTHRSSVYVAQENKTVEETISSIMSNVQKVV